MNQNNFYKSKYSKYKNKYLELKQKNLKNNQEGGIFPEQIRRFGFYIDKQLFDSIYSIKSQDETTIFKKVTGKKEVVITSNKSSMKQNLSFNELCKMSLLVTPYSKKDESSSTGEWGVSSTKEWFLPSKDASFSGWTSKPCTRILDKNTDDVCLELKELFAIARSCFDDTIENRKIFCVIAQINYTKNDLIQFTDDFTFADIMLDIKKKKNSLILLKSKLSNQKVPQDIYELGQEILEKEKELECLTKHFPVKPSS
jgi:hypothetical protein